MRDKGVFCLCFSPDTSQYRQHAGHCLHRLFQDRLLLCQDWHRDNTNQHHLSDILHVFAVEYVLAATKYPHSRCLVKQPKLITTETTNNFAILLERIKALANLNEKQIATIMTKTIID